MTTAELSDALDREAEAEVRDDIALDEIVQKFAGDSVDFRPIEVDIEEVSSERLDEIRDKFRASSGSPESRGEDSVVTPSDLDRIRDKFKAQQPDRPDFSAVRKSFNEVSGYGPGLSKVATSYRNDSGGEYVRPVAEGLRTVFADAASSVDPAAEGEGESGFRRGSTYDIVSEIGHGVGAAVINYFAPGAGTALKEAVVPVQRGLVRDNVSKEDRGL